MNLIRKLNIKTSVLCCTYVCALSLVPTDAFSFCYSFPFHYAFFYSFSFSIPFVTSLLLDLSLRSTILFLWRLVLLYSLLFILPQNYVFCQGFERRSPMHLCPTLTQPHTAHFPIIPSHLFMLAPCTTVSHLAASFPSGCSAKFITAFFLYLFKLLAGKITAVW